MQLSWEKRPFFIKYQLLNILSYVPSGLSAIFVIHQVGWWVATLVFTSLIEET